MHLIAPLAAGMAGCESGHAEIFQRGSASRSSYYANFEGTGATSTDDVTLDANGRANVYANEYVTVKCYDSAGTLVTTFTDGVADRNVEVISQSFTGAAYAGGGSAASLPVDLQTVLDLWYTSAGALDFKVDLDGTATILSTAIAGIYGHIFNVKAYGATGDGATDDRTAILAAKSAADTYGGMVYFPAGTYIFGSSISWTDTPMIGVPGQSILKSDSSVDLIDFLGSAKGSSTVYGVTFDCGVTVSDDTLDYDIVFMVCRFAPSSTAHADNDALAFGNGSSTNTLNVSLVECTGTHVLDKLIVDMSGCSDGSFRIIGGKYISIATAFTTTGSLFGCSAIDWMVSSPKIDLSATTTGTVRVFDLVNYGSNDNFSADGCVIVEPASVSAVVFYKRGLGGRFSDGGCILPTADVTNVLAYDLFVNGVGDESDRLYNLGTRRGRMYYESGTLDGTSVTLEVLVNFEIIHLHKTDTGAFNIDLDVGVPPGCKSTIVVHNDSGGMPSISLTGVDAGNDTTHTPANGNRTVYYVDYVALDGVIVNAMQDV